MTGSGSLVKTDVLSLFSGELKETVPIKTPLKGRDGIKLRDTIPRMHREHHVQTVRCRVV